MDSFYDDFPEPGFDEPAFRPSAQSSLLEGMNEDQVEAILHREGPALVVAGAGSGKTTVMTKRVAALIEAGVAPDSILLLTFTNKAAINMIERARRYTPFADRVIAGTFHSIGLRLIKENIHLFKLPSSPTIMTQDDCESAMKAIVKRLGKKDENLPDGATIQSINSFAVNTMRTLEDVVYDKHEQLAFALEFMEQCVAEYKVYKRERALFDFDDMLLVWNRMLDNPGIAAEIRARFTYILVDEHQDSNALQCAIIEKLGGTHPNVMVVGDPAQAIYAFRGSAPRTMFAFKDIWPNVKVIYLNTNYRSTEEVLAVGNAVDASMSERFDRQLEAAPGARGAMPQLVTVPSNDQEAIYIADKVLENKDRGIELSEQAIVVRALHVARAIEFEFARRKIPYRVFGGIKVSKARHIRAFFSVIRCAVNTLDEPAWIQALSIIKGVGPAMGEKVFKLIAGAPLALGDPTEIVLKKVNKAGVEKIMEAWRVLASGKDKPAVALDKALVILDDLLALKFPDNWKKSARHEIVALIGMAEQYDDLESYLATLTLDNSAEKNAGDVVDGETPITITTAHSAKGLEWDAVFIPNFVRGHMPSAFARDHESMEEEKRVLYVAVTRPRKQLVLTVPTMDFERNRNRQSDFEESIQDFCERKRWGQQIAMRGFGLSDNMGFSIDLDDL
ncbi:ATP-dependent helicase [Pararhizobium sp. BT-229]|uniref:ATP-dependent helicase n=1 Tax=Pararhizobium sp. BT-229 TaxID=2986923 RepID=UPI0021F6A738|nr:ATP-dependent helicase [Pararhizobium sp. BT-229]MCV9963534.1 ATP-dependent helicase [Pararhizobium sp. BT-229]